MSFSEIAEKKMWDLLKDYDTQVGSQYQGDRQGKTPTDCITYVMRVLVHAFESVGEPDRAKKVKQKSAKGTELASFLTSVSWKAYYWNPDVKKPSDGDNEHTFSYSLVKSKNSYYKIPITGSIINYRLTGGGAGDLTNFNKFKNVRFAYGLARGGKHTFLLSFGMVYEVHWDQIGASLYERSDFYNFPWLSGAVVIPPDSTFSI